MSQIAVRVKDIILNIEHPQAVSLGGYDAIGTIFFTKLDDNTPLEKTWTNLNNTARPIFSFLKNYPLINEIVLIMSSYDKSIYSTGGFTNYYFPILNIWNHPHHNALPTTQGLSDDSTKQDYKQTENGVAVRQIEDEGTDIDLGNYFKEQIQIKPLLPYEGDTIIEGRFGNSIRFGSTNISENILEENKNRWSSEEGKTGDPILIIRNGQLEDTDGKGWVHAIEDIDDDASSIYLTSNQRLESFIPASIYQKSFGANLVQPENINTLLTDPPLNVVNEPEIEEQEISDEEEPVLNSPPPITEEENPEETVVPENVAYYDVAPSEKNEIDKDTEVELDEISIKSINEYNLTAEELNKPMGDSYTPIPPPISIVETYRGFNIIRTNLGYYEVGDDPGSKPGSLEEYVYYDIGGGGMSDSSLSGIKETIDYSIEDFEEGSTIDNY